MFSKIEIDDLFARSIAALEVEKFTNEADFERAVFESLKNNTDPLLWTWHSQDKYSTLGLPNESEIKFDLAGVYNKSCKVLVELKYVMSPPGDFYAFPYDLLKDCVKIELAMSRQSDTFPAASDFPVVYGLSIGITDCPDYWEDRQKGKTSWSRNSLSHLRKGESGFERVETVGKSESKLQNTIFHKGNERCHLSFALNWQIRWSEQVSHWRCVTIAPSAVMHPKDQMFAYAHELTDPSYIPFLTPDARNDWVKKRDSIQYDN